MNALAHMHVFAYNLHAFGPNTAVRMHANVCMQTAFNCMRATHQEQLQEKDQQLQKDKRAA